jgi:AraC-type DNA-binding domain-containing proteins
MHQKKDGFKNEQLFVVPELYFKNLDEETLCESCFVTSIGYFPLALHHYRERPYGLSDFLLIYCVGGEGMVQFSQNTPYQLKQGQVAILPPNISHTYYASKNNPWSIFWIHLNGKHITKLWKKGDLGESRYLRSSACILLENLFYECFQVMKQKYTEKDYFYLCQIVSHILGVIFSSITEVVITEKGEKAVQTTITYMKQNLHRSITLNEISELTHYSSSHLNQLFRRIKQSSPIEYFIQMKLQAASRELYFSKLPIKDIAMKYGFDDPLYFSRLFRKVFGVSPNTYRNQQRG